MWYPNFSFQQLARYVVNLDTTNNVQKIIAQAQTFSKSGNFGTIRKRTATVFHWADIAYKADTSDAHEMTWCDHKRWIAYA